MIALLWVLFAFAVILIIVSFVMSPDSNSFSGALVGSSDLDLFKTSKEKGIKKILKWSMFALGLILMILSLVLRAVM